MANNPFDDIYAYIDSDIDSPKSYKDHKTKTISFPVTVAVPSINAPPSRSSSSNTDSSASSISSAPSTPPPLYFPIVWTNADLDYLLSVLCPDQVMARDLFFDPPLGSLRSDSYPFCLKLYLRIPTQSIPTGANTAIAPIGTGRQTNKRLIVNSALCSSPASARRSLAERLLSERCAIQHTITHYHLLSALYSLPAAVLSSLKRGMLSMAQTSKLEWCGRLSQFRAACVDDSWSFDARLEAFLLERGWWELGRWLTAVEVALGLKRGDRECWAGVYREAGRFLEVALSEV